MSLPDAVTNVPILPDNWITKGRALPGCIINADTDKEACETWLDVKGSRSPNTRASYRREAQRLLLWLIEVDLTLDGMRVEHVHGFFTHLSAPPAHWIRPRKPAKDVELSPTQVLCGGLSNKSIDYARTVLSQLFGYLLEAGYVRRNPFRLSAKPPVVIETSVSRFLDLDTWHWLWSWIQGLPETNHAEKTRSSRTRWVFALLYHTGIRRSEVAQGVMSDFIRRDNAWSLRVVGKRNKERFVTVNTTLLSELVLYRRFLNLDDYPSPGEQIPLVARCSATSLHKQSSTRKPVTPDNLPLRSRSVGLIVASVAKAAAIDCEDPHFRNQIQNMSVHWLRHTNATHRSMAGASLESTQDELGHSDPRTTRIYAKTSDSRRREDAEKLAVLDRTYGAEHG